MSPENQGVFQLLKEVTFRRILALSSSWEECLSCATDRPAVLIRKLLNRVVLESSVGSRYNSLTLLVSPDPRRIMTDVTRILNAIEQGDAGATEKLLPLVYEELRLLAAQKLSQEPPGQTLQATALVHEAYVRLVEGGCEDWNSRGHFFRAAAEAMRRILVENARRKKSVKGGGGYERINFDVAIVSNPGRPEELIALDEALSKLSLEDPPVVELVKLRYFAGLTLDQAAKVMGVSRRTAFRYWDYGRVRLLHEMTKSDR